MPSDIPPNIALGFNMEQRGLNDAIDIDKKGKGKAKEESSLPPDAGSPIITPSNPHSESALSRLAASSASLASNFMASRSYVHDSVDALSTSKAESSRAQHSGTALQETTRITQATFPNVRSSLGNTFKSAQSHARTGDENNSFTAFLETAGHANDQAVTSSPDQTSAYHVTHDVVDVPSDGSKVVDILEAEVIEEDDNNYGLQVTMEELSILETAALGEKQSTRDDVLNFVPDFISNSDSNEAFRQLANHLGVSDATEARNIWFAQWGDVLSSYTDVVWGNLGPLITTARQELQRMSTNPEGATLHGLDAVRRLQQILTHVRDSR